MVLDFIYKLLVAVIDLPLVVIDMTMKVVNTFVRNSKTTEVK